MPFATPNPQHLRSDRTARVDKPMPRYISVKALLLRSVMTDHFRTKRNARASGLVAVLFGTHVPPALLTYELETWGQEKRKVMTRSLLIPALALGVALSGSAFGQSWTKSTTTNPQSPANTYSPNTFDQQQMRAQEHQKNAMTSQPNSAKSPSSNSAKMTGQQNPANPASSKPASSAKMTAPPNSSSSNTVNTVESHGD